MSIGTPEIKRVLATPHSTQKYFLQYFCATNVSRAQIFSLFSIDTTTTIHPTEQKLYHDVNFFSEKSAEVFELIFASFLIVIKFCASLELQVDLKFARSLDFK